MESINKENDQIIATHIDEFHQHNVEQNNVETIEYKKLLIKNLKTSDSNPWC